MPLPLLWPGGAGLIMGAVGERTASKIPGATLVRLPGCGHFLPEEDPDAFAQAATALVHGSNDGRPEGHEGSTAPVVANLG